MPAVVRVLSAAVVFEQWRYEREHRAVYLQARTLGSLRALPAQLWSPHGFVNPTTAEPWLNIRHMFDVARKADGLPDLWLHDPRRSFVTLERRCGFPGSVVMPMSGHRTRAVFDRHNIVSEDDLREGVARIESARKAGSDLAPVAAGSESAPPAASPSQGNCHGKLCARQGTILQPLGSKPNALSN